MTTRKLTPAEALEVFRDWRAVERADMTSTAFYDKWGTFDHAVWSAIAALEEALAQKLPATPMPIADIEQGTFVVVSPGVSCRFADRVIVRRFDEHEPAAAQVPSDDDDGSICSVFRLINATGVEKPRDIKAMLCYLIGVSKKLARRIGVQGVPK